MMLNDALLFEPDNRSPFASKVIVMHLLQECFDLGHHQPTNLGDMEEGIFWNNYQHLDRSLDVTASALARGGASFTNTLQLNTAVISLHRAATGRATSGTHAAPSLQSKALPAAQEIVTTIALASDINDRFKNPSVSFASFMASYVFLDKYLDERDEASIQNLMALLDVMISVGLYNPGFPASLAIQLARELNRMDVDPLALEKVNPTHQNEADQQD